MTKKNPYIKFQTKEIEEVIDDILNSDISDAGLDEKRKRFEELFRKELKRLINK